MKAKMSVIILALACTTAGAAEQASHQTLSFDPEVFQEQRYELVRELKVGDTYTEISDQDRGRVLAALDTLGGKLGNVSSVDQLEANEKVVVYNLQSEINQILTSAAEESREVCSRHKPVGTNFPQTICKTVAEWRRIRENNQNYFRARKTAGLVKEGANITRSIQ